MIKKFLSKKIKKKFFFLIILLEKKITATFLPKKKGLNLPGQWFSNPEHNSNQQLELFCKNLVTVASLQLTLKYKRIFLILRFPLTESFLHLWLMFLIFLFYNWYEII